MDQLKIGKFIAQTRKEKGLTQKQLADALLISDKTVSKWECGNGMPEVSLMMPLCEKLDITVNELLSGCHLSTSDYQKNAEENIMKLIQEKQEAKFRMIIEVLVIFITLLSGCSLIMLTGLADLRTPNRIALIVVSVIIFVVGIGVCAALEMRNARFKCVKCGEKFYPSKTAYIMGVHTITRRHLKCPKCGKRSWCIRCDLSSDEEEE
ncbi:MAG: helix-turn-helix transcriptional regulator [Clostridia bacterium]|nr:helix-turn-helix transcriptional regulator [Clostridia bacterium]